MKTGARANLRKTGLDGPGAGPSRSGPDTRIEVPKRGIGRRIGAGVAGILIALFALTLASSGYEKGPEEATGSRTGIITIEHCDPGRRGHSAKCSGDFRSDDGRFHHAAEDVKTHSGYEKGEQVPAMVPSPGKIEFGSPTSFYIDAARFWCLAALVFGIALAPLNYAVRPVRRPMGGGMMLTIFILMIGGLLGCGLCVLVNSWLI